MAASVREIIRNQYIEHGISRALNGYCPSDRFDGRIILAYSTGSTDPRAGERTQGWSRYASLGVQVHEIRAERDSWFPEAVEAFADIADSAAPPMQDTRAD